MRQASRALTAALAVVALAASAPGAASARPAADSLPGAPSGASGERLPEGWRFEGGELVWSSPEPVGMGGALVEFRSQERTLGVPAPSADHRTFRLRVDRARVGPVGELRVVAGTRRLDAAGTGRAPGQRRSPAETAPPAPLPVHSVDPGVPGEYRTTSGEYALKPVRLPGYKEPVEMRATVVGPTDAPGKRPFALFLHGRAATCYQPGKDALGMEWPCEPGHKEVPSHRGHLHDQELLASQGYVTVSISANGINAVDNFAADAGAQARSSLVRLHLARWAEWGAKPAKAPEAVRAVDPADLSKVLLVGHSRGGEGVNRAALDSVSPPPRAEDGYRGPVGWRIRGTVLIGPTLFGQNPAPDVPSVTILPGCDGDVSDLQGQMYLDASRGVGRGTALHSAVYMVGANHNYFNTEWTPGQAEAPAFDDASDHEDPVCSVNAKSRLSAKHQQTAGTAYVAAAARLFLTGDDRVRPLLDGSGRRAPSAGAARVLTHAVGGRRTPAILPDAPLSVTNGRVCQQITTSETRACRTGSEPGRSPHFAPWSFFENEPGRNAVRADWAEPGAPVRLTPKRAFSLAGSEALALRVIVPPDTRGTRLDIAVTDTSGKRVRLGRVTVDGLPGPRWTAAHWASEVRVPLKAAAAAGVDLKRIRSLELTPRSASGELWLMDAWGWRPGTPAVRPAALPRVDIGRLKVEEGDSGTRTYRVPVQVTGEGTGVIKLAVLDPDTYRSTVRTVKVKDGGSAETEITVRGNSRYDIDLGHEIAVKAVRGTAVGGAIGGVLVENDDPMPTVTVTPVADSVTEGGKLSWKAALSEPADTTVETRLDLLPVPEGTELSTKDVDKEWLAGIGGDADPERPLSRDTPSLWVAFPEGETSADVSVPTAADTLTEPEESLRMRMSYLKGHEWMEGPLLTGGVMDAPRR
ncbi:hypothetical protein GCM10010387_29500 [Streptomyces inusitatus]|uniref:Secreted protein n=1 Tax=Streptomyces inusitatus TaxID=68221 RepID=A0A918Q5G4_9ACTN|nr:hypothetical protein [Streptomyces inusitatus]GGZ33452.1 hypothetical protein GCM10010387_29500 [Streptomyces inusitatus]